MSTEMELTLEQTQQGVSYEVSVFTMKMEILLKPTSNKLMVMDQRLKNFELLKKLSMCHKTTLASDTSIDFQIDFLYQSYDESNTYVLERFNTTAGNPVKKILLKLNLSDHRLFKDGGGGQDVKTELLELYTKLSERVLDLENTKTSQAAEITKLKERVMKLERRNKSRTPGLKRLRKVGRSAQVVSSEDEGLGAQEDASKQGRKIIDLDVDAEVTLVDEAQGRNDDNLMFDTGVFDEQEVKVKKAVSTAEVTTVSATTTTVDELTLAQTLIEIKAAKLKAVTTAATITTTAVTRSKARGVVVQEPTQLNADMEEEEKLAKQREEDANIAEWDTVQAMIDVDYELAGRLQAQEQEELTVEEKSKLFVELVDKRKNILQDLEQKSKEENHQLKLKGEIKFQKAFDKTMGWIDSFVSMDSEVVKRGKEKDEGSVTRAEESSSNIAGTELEQERIIKQNQEEAEMKRHMEIVVDEEDIAVDAIPLTTKPPIIVDRKIVKKRKDGILSNHKSRWKFKESMEKSIRIQCDSLEAIFFKWSTFCEISEYAYLFAVTAAKRLRIKQYFQVQDYALWDVIKNGNSFKPVPQTTTNADGTSTSLIPGPVTTEEKAQKKNDVKARSMLLMALPNEHLMTFNLYQDAKTMFVAIQTRFGGNEATKKTQKTLLKQMYENFSAPSTESLDSIFNRLQKINKPDLDTMSFDDLYNNFKIVEQEVKGTASSSSSSSSQNMAFVSSPSSTNEVNTAYGVSTANTQVSPASTQVSTASTQVSTANLSDDTVYAFLASQPNGSQLVYEDLEQIHEDDIEEMDLKWQLALLSMRTRRFFQKTGRKITINGSDTAGYDKSKVECFNCHKMGHFARECRGPRNQDSRNRNQDSSRRTVNVEETSSKAMVAIDGAGFDWSYMADDEVPTNMALMAFSDSEVHNDKTCSKTCLKSFETLKTQLDDLRIEFNKFEFNLATYNKGLSSVEVQLIFYKKNELEKLKQEKESNQLKIENFDNASKRLFLPPNLDLSYSSLEKFQQPKFEGYGPKSSKSVSKDISNEVRESTDASLVEEFVSDDKLERKIVFPTVAKMEFVRPKQQEKPVRKPVKYAEMYSESFDHVQADCNYHKKERVVSRNNYTRVNYNYSGKKAHPSALRNMVLRAVLMKTGLKPFNTARTVNTAHPKSIIFSAKPMSRFSKSAQSTIRRPYQSKTVLSNKRFTQTNNTAKAKVVNTARPKAVNTARPKAVNTARPHLAVVNAVRVNQANAGKPQQDDTGFIDSGCSRHMTGNIAYLWKSRPHIGVATSLAIHGLNSFCFNEFDGDMLHFSEEPKEEKLLHEVLNLDSHGPRTATVRKPANIEFKKSPDRVSQLATSSSVTGASQSNKHIKSESDIDTSLIHIESRKSPTKSLIDVGSRRISIFTVNTKEYHSDVLAIITRMRRLNDTKLLYIHLNLVEVKDSRNCVRIQRTWAQQADRDTYSASAVDSAVQSCFFEDH
ncbi:ribonuclease H-like domain-containing protein [Tanacetum coccineum]